MDTRKIAGIGMMIALAFVLSYLESLIPLPLGIPGIKLGLSNLVVVCCLYRFSPRITLFVALVRIVLAGLTFGSLVSMLYSLAGGMLSLAGMYLLKRLGWFSVYGVSLAGGVLHNLGQILVACAILQTGLLAYYLPILIVSGTVAGLGIGSVSGLLIKRLQTASGWNSDLMD